MKYPKRYFFDRKVPKVTYSTDLQGSNGNIQLLNGQLHFELITTERIETKRSLILADWTAATWNESHLSAVTLKLAQLLEDVFHYLCGKTEKLLL